jgi:CHAT domain-containing protein
VQPAPSVNDAALKAWRTAHNEKLKKEGADSQKRSDDELAKAKVELDKMTADWEAKKKKNHERNVQEEKKFVAERDAAFASHGWQNVGRYVDLKGIEAAGGERDVTRMREVLTKSLSRK